jgi:Ca2+-binding EF-hand superfamily protein
LDAEDLAALLSSHGIRVTTDEIQVMIYEYDLNHDFKLDYDEFRGMVEQSQGSKAVVT